VSAIGPDGRAGRSQQGARVARRVRVTAPEHAPEPDLGTLIRTALYGEQGHGDERIRALVRLRLRLALRCATTFAVVLAAAVLVHSGAGPAPPGGSAGPGALLRWGMTGLVVFLVGLGCAAWFQVGSGRLERAWHEEAARRGHADAR
jgi:hypothetical protein